MLAWSSLCLFRFSFQFLSFHNAVLTVWLGLHTVPTRLGLGEHRGLGLNSLPVSSATIRDGERKIAG